MNNQAVSYNYTFNISTLLKFDAEKFHQKFLFLILAVHYFYFIQKYVSGINNVLIVVEKYQQNGVMIQCIGKALF